MAVPVLRINELFKRIRGDTTIDVPERTQLYKVVRTLLEHRKRLEVRNDVWDVWMNLSDIADAIDESELSKDAIIEGMERIFEIPSVKEYLEQQGAEDSDEDTDTDSADSADDETDADVTEDDTNTALVQIDGNVHKLITHQTLAWRSVRWILALLLLSHMISVILGVGEFCRVHVDGGCVSAGWSAASTAADRVTSALDAWSAWGRAGGGGRPGGVPDA
jgi:hypothetical protein